MTVDLTDNLYQFDGEYNPTHMVGKSLELEARLGSREQNIPLTLCENMIAERLETPFANESTSDSPARGLGVKVLLNVSPTGANESRLKPQYAAALVSMLRSIMREPDLRRLTVIAFNLRAQKIVYRHED
jgi:hypothetical protein